MEQTFNGHMITVTSTLQKSLYLQKFQIVADSDKKQRELEAAPFGVINHVTNADC